MSHLDVVKLLLSTEEINVNQADEDGVTALFIALQEGHLNVETSAWIEQPIADKTALNV